ncbi:hypothetical protein COLINT_03220 [Collinsella intestinalis DSM 13280]|uniref:Uncharacterized protein n=1 Tax=Collinsella intestinalis DSM 13280 TaxID=521003 RepID=C4FAX3_9ACTN|nr:hypothetical protein COLINT_03220 [Collinsella intestinalis DSM 13280]
MQLVSLRFIHIAPWGAAAFEARRTLFSFRSPTNPRRSAGS